MKKSIIIGLLLLAFSLIHPVLFYYYEGEHIKLTESNYKVRDNSHNHTSEIEKYAQMRIIYQAYKNIKLHRTFSLVNIDDNTALNSYPIYQYYNFGISHLLGLVLFIVPDVIIAYTIGLWFFSALFVGGLYLLVTKISGSRKTAFLVILILLTYPYFLVNLLTRYANAEYFAISMVPMLIYLIILLLEKVTGIKNVKDTLNIIEYCFYSSLFTLLGSLFIITHNITTLYTPVLLGIPLLVYVFTTIKPSLKSFLFLIIPFAVIIGSSLFILVPVAQNQQTLLISDTFSGLLFPNFNLNDSSVAFRVFPFTSPHSGQPFLTLQFGVPVLLLALVFFRIRNIYIYLLAGIVVWLVISPTLWYVLPPIFYVTQFSMRLFTYVPLLLLFAVRPLSKPLLIGMTLVTLFFGFFFIQRPNSLHSFFENDYDQFPSENHWNYMQKGANANIPAPVAVDPPGDPVTPKKISNTRYLIDALKNYEYGRKAVTYVITVPSQTKAELFHSYTNTEFKDGRKTRDMAEHWAVDNTIVLSYCLPNTKEITVEFEPPKYIQSFTVERLWESQYMLLDTSLIATSCDYEYKNNGQDYLYHLDEKFAKTQLLTIYYSPYNIVTGEDGQPLETKPFLDAAQRSHTVVMDRGSNKTIRVQLSARNTWIPLSLTLLRLTLLVFAITGVLFPFLIRKRHTMKRV
jgi:hypothetical protein